MSGFAHKTPAIVTETLAVALDRLDDLGDPALSIGGATFDALLFWGVPLIVFAVVAATFRLSASLPPLSAERLRGLLVAAGTTFTYAHLFAVVPRAYLNPDVFAANRRRLILMPVALLAAFVLSPTALIIGGVVAFFWDVHHSAMQTFGLARIYDMKAGNNPHTLRATDLRLSWALYVGPIAAGAALFAHVDTLHKLDATALYELATLPGIFHAEATPFRALAISAWLVTLMWTAVDYRRALRQGYRLPTHKIMVLGSTGLVSILAWGLSSPLVAFLVVNVFHSLQYFAIVWLKEGDRMSRLADISRSRAFGWFFGCCFVFGIAYSAVAVQQVQLLFAPFVAVSLLHFWYDSFVWSVRKQLV
jgi:hypothetical protein